MVVLEGAKPDYIVRPGEVLKDFLDANGMTQKELAKEMKITEKTMVQLISAKSPINQEYAYALEVIFGVPKSFWMNLQRNYDDQLAEKERERQDQNQIQIAKKIPSETFKKMGLLPKGRIDKHELVRIFQKIFRLVDLNDLVIEDSFAFRIHENYEVDKLSLFAWIRLGEVKVRDEYNLSEISTFKPEKIMQKKDEFRELVKIGNLDFLDELKKLCFENGILFTMVPEIQGSRISGMVRWIDIQRRKVPILQVSFRGKTHDLFWFTFFHELGHLVLHNEQDFLDGGQTSTDFLIKEKEADDFAADLLIPSVKYQEFIEEEDFTKRSILRFAEEINSHPSIVLGRLKREGYVQYWQYQELTPRYQWVFE